MNIRLRRPVASLTPEVAADVARIRAIWRGCRARAASGELLFGGFTIADAMFAPVVARFRTYGVALDGPEAEYADALWRHAAVQKWVADAKAESHSIPKYDGRVAEKPSFFSSRRATLGGRISRVSAHTRIRRTPAGRVTHRTT
jgi:glutathione S-transferase